MRKGMRTGLNSAVVPICLMMLAAAVTRAEDSRQQEEQQQSQFFRPVTLSLQPAAAERESVYAPPAPPREEEGVNEGAVHFDLLIGYFTDYVFRGIERFDAALGHEDRANSTDCRLRLDHSSADGLGGEQHLLVSGPK
jgi:hypothetical protein